jgi:hypothetical protein
MDQFDFMSSFKRLVSSLSKHVECTTLPLVLLMLNLKVRALLLSQQIMPT